MAISSEKTHNGIQLKVDIKSLHIIEEEYCDLLSHVQGSLWLLEEKVKVKEAKRMEETENAQAPALCFNLTQNPFLTHNYLLYNYDAWEKVTK